MKKPLLALFISVAALGALAPVAAPAQTSAAKSDSPSWMERWFGGPGMMWGRGSGPEGYGPGMMGGYGWRQGGGMGSMMGMMGVGGYGMMGMGPYYMLDLSEQQRGKINQIQDEMRKKNWELMGRMLDEQARLRDLYAADKRDPAAIGQQSMKIADLRRQLTEASVDAHNRIEALLSKEQRERLRRFGHGWMMGDD